MIRVTLDVMLARSGLSTEDVAREVGIARKNLWALKAGKVTAIRLEVLDALCRVLDCTPGELLAFEGPSRRGRDAVSAPPIEAREQAILDVLAKGELLTDDVITRTGIDAGAAIAALLSLELAGLVTRRTGGFYRLR